jgi:hypothetical protein
MVFCRMSLLCVPLQASDVSKSSWVLFDDDVLLFPRDRASVGGGCQLNVDRRFDPILIVESTIIFRNSCRFVDRFLA